MAAQDPLETAIRRNIKVDRANSARKSLIRAINDLLNASYTPSKVKSFEPKSEDEVEEAERLITDRTLIFDNCVTEFRVACQKLAE